jgi:hypothetical protein
MFVGLFGAAIFHAGAQMEFGVVASLVQLLVMDLLMIDDAFVNFGDRSHALAQ